MSCVFCGGKVALQNVTFIYEHSEQLIVIKNVPALVCDACGERTYSPETTEEIMQFARRHFKPIKLVQVPVFDYEHKVAAAV